jgi:hypothetical protein
METDPSGQAPESARHPTEFEETQIAAALRCQFADGTDCLPRHVISRLLEMAVASGFVDHDGFLTRRGRLLLARHHYA